MRKKDLTEIVQLLKDVSSTDLPFYVQDKTSRIPEINYILKYIKNDIKKILTRIDRNIIN